MNWMNTLYFKNRPSTGSSQPPLGNASAGWGRSSSLDLKNCQKTSDLGMGARKFGDATGDTSSGIWDSHPFHSCLWILWVLWVQGKAEMRGNPPSSPPFCLCRASLFPPPGQHSSASRPGSDDSSLCRVGSDTSHLNYLWDYHVHPCSSIFYFYHFLSSHLWKTIILRVWGFWFPRYGPNAVPGASFPQKAAVFPPPERDRKRKTATFWRDPHPKPCKPRPDWKVLSTNKLRFG